MHEWCTLSGCLHSSGRAAGHRRRVLPQTFRGSRYGAALASELLALLLHLLSRARHRGMLVLNAVISRPHDSPLFQRYPRVLASPFLLACITDCLRLLGNLDDRDMDALPAFCFVAAVLGALVAQAMVGTFMGILLSYGCASSMRKPRG